MKLSGARGRCGLFFVLFLCLSCSLRPAIFLFVVCCCFITFVFVDCNIILCVCVCYVVCSCLVAYPKHYMAPAVTALCV